MKLEIVRTTYTANSTIGGLYIDGVFECFTLEDTFRPDGTKIAGKTCIPEGTYYVVIDFSNRFQRMMPHILAVPGFDGIRIHSGNIAADTKGCPIVGRSKGIDRVDESRAAFNSFLQSLQIGLTKGQVQITVRRDS